MDGLDVLPGFLARQDGFQPTRFPPCEALSPLVALPCGSFWQERLFDSILYEERVEPVRLNANQAIPLLSSELHEGWKRRPTTVGLRSQIEPVIGSVGHRHAAFRATRSVEFQDHDPWTDAVQCPPHPIVVAVYVKRQQVDGTGETIVTNQCIHIVGCYPAVYECGGRDPCEPASRVELLTPADLSRIAVEQKPLLSMIDDQVRGIAFDSITRADFQNSPIGRTEQGHDIEENSILTILREALELDIREARQLGSDSNQVLILQTKEDLGDLCI